MYQNIPTKVLTGEVRLSYCNLTTPRASQQGGEPKYSVTMLIPKSDTATKADIDASIQAAVNEAVSKKWGGVRPPMIKDILHDGDGVRPSGLPYGPECKGHWVLTASTKNPPQVVGIDNIRTELATILLNFSKLAEASKGYTETAVSIEVPETDGIPAHTVPAIVTVPDGEGPFAAVVMLHGTGSDKHEAGMGYDYAAPVLAKAGIATIRFDFMGNGESTASYADYCYSSANIDAKAAADYVAALENVNADKIGIMASSLRASTPPMRPPRPTASTP